VICDAFRSLCCDWCFNPLKGRGNFIATSNNMKLYTGRWWVGKCNNIWYKMYQLHIIRCGNKLPLPFKGLNTTHSECLFSVLNVHSSVMTSVILMMWLCRSAWCWRTHLAVLTSMSSQWHQSSRCPHLVHQSTLWLFSPSLYVLVWLRRWHHVLTLARLAAFCRLVALNVSSSSLLKFVILLC